MISPEKAPTETPIVPKIIADKITLKSSTDLSFMILP